MLTYPNLSETILDQSVSADGRSVEQIAELARSRVAEQRICLIHDVPIDADRYLALLSEFGQPLPNYSSKSDLAKDDPHPQINRVKYKRKADITKESVHYVADGLRPHSARSWCAPRPAYFAMLMVDPGWRDTEPGERGESVVLSWRNMFAALAEQDGELFDRYFQRLSQTPITFQANNVREQLSDSPLLYPLPDARDRFDVGVRLKQDMRQKVLNLAESIPDFEEYQQALSYVLDNSELTDYQAEFPMDSGDLLLLDNNRFAHGRRRIVGERAVGDEIQTNHRELWSVTVG